MNTLVCALHVHVVRDNFPTLKLVGSRTEPETCHPLCACGENKTAFASGIQCTRQYNHDRIAFLRTSGCCTERSLQSNRSLSTHGYGRAQHHIPHRQTQHHSICRRNKASYPTPGAPMFGTNEHHLWCGWRYSVRCVKLDPWSICQGGASMRIKTSRLAWTGPS